MLKMWSCHKCGKPVFFAERKQSLGYDWHPECLRCDECGKRLNPGQHAEHKGVPYCHVPCYSVLFGPTLFGHGSQVEAHTSFGKVEKKLPPGVDKGILESKLKVYNHYYEGNSCQLKWKERNGKLILEGVLRIYWGVNNLIHLKENEDQRHHVQIRKRNSYRETTSGRADDEDDSSDDDDNFAVTNNYSSPKKYSTLPSRSRKPINEKNGDVKSHQPCVDDIDTPLTEVQVSPCVPRTDNEQPTVPSILVTDESADHTDGLTTAEHLLLVPSISDDYNSDLDESIEEVALRPKREKVDLSRVQIRKMSSSRAKTKLKRRCSINGHFYNRDTKTFKPPYGSGSNVWVTSMVNTHEVINLLLEKFCVENSPDEFALYIVRDNGEIRRVKDDEHPLLVRVMLGPHDDVAKVFIMDRKKTEEISNEVAQYLNFQEPELKNLLRKFSEEEEREAKKIKLKYNEIKRIIKARLSTMTPTTQQSMR